ncbi:MAG: SDR family oxidoreductase, partial [Actinomycetota bacterium]
IVRISWVCGRHGTNMVKTILRLMAEHDELRFVDDQHGNPTFAEDLAPLLRRLAAERRTGTFHATNQGVTTWFEFARSVLAAAGQDPARVAPIATAELDPPRPAPRPANSVLDNAVLRAEGIPLLPDHRESLVRLVRELTA